MSDSHLLFILVSFLVILTSGCLDLGADSELEHDVFGVEYQPPEEFAASLENPTYAHLHDIKYIESANETQKQNLSEKDTRASYTNQASQLNSTHFIISEVYISRGFWENYSLDEKSELIKNEAVINDSVLTNRVRNQKMFRRNISNREFLGANRTFIMGYTEETDERFDGKYLEGYKDERYVGIWSQHILMTEVDNRIHLFQYAKPINSTENYYSGFIDSIASANFTEAKN
jgi:hypothetical protein